MANPTKPTYTHGSTGTEPSSALDYTNGDPLEADNLDYYVNTPLEKIKDIIDTLNAIDSDGDGVVDAADTAAQSDTTALYKNNDIDSDGDGKVDVADTADIADTANLYKNNDIDSDGDGVVDAADQLETGGSTAVIRDTTNTRDLLQASESGTVTIPSGNLDLNGNSVVDSTGGSVSINADKVDGKDADDLGVVVEDNGTAVYSPSTGVNFGTGIDVADDGDGTVTVTAASTLTQLSIDANKDWGNYDISNVRKFTAEDGMVMNKTLETTEAFTIEAGESMVVSGDYTVGTDSTLTIKDGGSMTVM